MKGKLGLTILSLTSLLIVGCDSKKTNAHIHEYSEDYSYDDKGHYNVCIYDGCKNRTIYKPHEFISSGKCVICGYYDSNRNTTKNYAGDYVGVYDGHYKVDNKGNRITNLEEHTLVEYDGDAKHVEAVATCSLPGKGFKQCTVCGKVVDYVIPKTDHDFQPKPIVDTSMRDNCTLGYTLECTMCHISKYQPPTGHQVYESGLIDGITKVKCASCAGEGAILYVSNATGWDRNDIKMDGKSSPNNKSTWNVDGILGDGFYDIEIEAVMEKESYADRKWYNMSKKELCVNNVVEDKYSDTTEQDDYRYYFKVNDSTIITPTVKESWGELGFVNGSYKYGLICKSVYISGANTFSLCHGNIDYPLIIYSIKVIKLHY